MATQRLPGVRDRRTDRPVVKRPPFGQPGSGHVYIVEHKDDRIRATCSCREFVGQWRLNNYDDAKADFFEVHGAEVKH